MFHDDCMNICKAICLYPVKKREKHPFLFHYFFVYIIAVLNDLFLLLMIVLI